MGTLKVTINTGGTKKLFEFDKSKIIIGRSQNADISHQFNGSSRMHCKITVDDNKVYITDLSSNGSFIDDAKLLNKIKTEYSKGNILKLGLSNDEIIIEHPVLDDIPEFDETIQLEDIDKNGFQDSEKILDKSIEKKLTDENIEVEEKLVFGVSEEVELDGKSDINLPKLVQEDKVMLKTSQVSLTLKENEFQPPQIEDMIDEPSEESFSVDDIIKDEDNKKQEALEEIKKEKEKEQDEEKIPEIDKIIDTENGLDIKSSLNIEKLVANQNKAIKTTTISKNATKILEEKEDEIVRIKEKVQQEALEAEIIAQRKAVEIKESAKLEAQEIILESSSEKRKIEGEMLSIRKRLEEEVQQLESEKKQIENEVTTKQKERELVSAEIETKKNIKEGFLQELHSFNLQKEDAEKELIEKKGMIVNINTNLNVELKKIDTEKKLSIQKIELKRSELDSFEAEKKTNLDIIESKYNEFSQLEITLSEQLNKIEKRLVDTKVEVEAATKAKQGLQSSIEDSRSIKAEISDDIVELKKKRDKLLSDVSALKVEINLKMEKSSAVDKDADDKRQEFEKEMRASESLLVIKDKEARENEIEYEKRISDLELKEKVLLKNISEMEDDVISDGTRNLVADFEEETVVETVVTNEKKSLLDEKIEKELDDLKQSKKE